MHYTGFPSALHSPCLPTFSHLHFRLVTLGTFPTLCTHRRLKSIGEKIAEHRFNPFRAEQRAFTSCKAVDFPACRDLAEPRANPTYSASLWCGMCNTTWNPQRGIWQSGMWIPLNTSSCEGMWPRAAPFIAMTESGVRAKGIWKSRLWTSLLPIYFLAACPKCKLDPSFWIGCSKMTWHLNYRKETAYWQPKLNHEAR